MQDSIIEIDPQCQASPTLVRDTSYANHVPIFSYQTQGGSELLTSQGNQKQFITYGKRNIDQKNHSITEGVQQRLIDQYGVQYGVRPSQTLMNQSKQMTAQTANLQIQPFHKKLQHHLTSPSNSNNDLQSQANSGGELSNVYKDQSVNESKHDHVQSFISYNVSERMPSHSKRSTASLGRLEKLVSQS